MSRDFLEQLSKLDVPAPPVEFDRQFHRRLNHALLVQQTLDLVVRAMPWAILHFARALAGAIGYTLTGRFPGPDATTKSEI
jgi:class 3 adenylate cyclase